MSEMQAQARICPRCHDLEIRLRRAVDIMRCLVDSGPCRYDHHGYCQTHSLGQPCEHEQANAFLAKYDADNATLHLPTEAQRKEVR